jgi:predicted transcriptional regulator/DNA-binding XRE family transcriptional regulator
MRAPIGIRISAKRRAIGLSQAALARLAGISPSYLNLIERNKREVGGALLRRLAEHLRIEIGELTGESEHRLLAELEEAFSDPVLASLGLGNSAGRDLLAHNPVAAQAMARLHRAYQGALASADDYANRLRSDPLFSQLLHQVLSAVTAVRSGAEILTEFPDLDDEQRRRFATSISREAHNLTDIARSLVGEFDREAEGRRSLSPIRELDDLIFANDNYFPLLEAEAAGIRAEIERYGAFGETALAAALESRFGVAIARGAGREVDALGFPGQYHFNPETRTMWLQNSATAATRQFQLTRLFAELSGDRAIAATMEGPPLTSPTARRIGYRAMGSYLAGAIVFPYDRFLADAEAQRYDIETLRQAYTASFEQVAHRLVTLRRPGAAGIPFGFLRSDPAGRLTKHFPLPGLLLPNSGHACPLWAIYHAFRVPETTVRQLVRFSDGSRYLFLARAGSRRAASFGDRAVLTSVMLACDVLHADRTVYAAGLDLGDLDADIPVGPSCRLCPRRDCADRQEEALAPGGGQAAIRAPLVPRRFDVGDSL